MANQVRQNNRLRFPQNVNVVNPGGESINHGDGEHGTDTTPHGDVQKVQPLLAALMAHLPTLLQNMPQDEMAVLRAYLPFLPIMQFPLYNVQVHSDAVNAIDIICPDGAVLVKFSASGAFVANMTGLARYSGVPDTVQQNPDQNFGAINPVDAWYYLPNVKTISVLAIDAPCKIGASFLVQI